MQVENIFGLCKTCVMFTVLTVSSLSFSMSLFMIQRFILSACSGFLPFMFPSVSQSVIFSFAIPIHVRIACICCFLLCSFCMCIHTLLLSFSIPRYITMWRNLLNLSCCQTFLSVNFHSSVRLLSPLLVLSVRSKIKNFVFLDT